MKVSVQYVEIASLFTFYDKMYLSHMKSSFTKNFIYFFNNCVTTEKQQYLLHSETFVNNQQRVNNLLRDYHNMNGRYSQSKLTVIFYQLLLRVIKILKERLETEVQVSKYEFFVQFISQNIKFFTLELHYLAEALDNQLNYDGSQFENARVICSTIRLTEFLSELIEICELNFKQSKKTSTSFTSYMQMIIQHLCQVVKISLQELHPYRNAVREESLFIKCLGSQNEKICNQQIQIGFQLKHLYNEITFQEMNKAKKRILKYNDAYLESILNQLTVEQQQAKDLVSSLEQSLNSYIREQESDRIDYSQLYQEQKKDRYEGFTVQMQKISHKMQKKSEILKNSQAYSKSENNPFNSPLALTNPDLMINENDTIEPEEEKEDNEENAFKTSKLITNSIGFQSKYDDNDQDLQWRNFDLKELEMRGEQTKFNIPEIVLETEEDPNSFQAKRQVSFNNQD